MLVANLLSTHNAHLPSIRDLSSVEYSTFSQYGEDGIISWITSHFPDIPRVFVEFGVEDYHEANTRQLLLSSWSGYVFDSDASNINKIKSSEIYWKYNIHAEQQYISSDNVNSVFKACGVPTEIGLLSIDIDSNDFWVLDAIDSVKPYFLICEYNSLFGDLHPISIVNTDGFKKNSKENCNAFFGASIRALILKAKK
jgi:hypothetical protein